PIADRGKVFRFILYAVKTSATGCTTSEPAKSKDAYTIGKPLPPTGLTTKVAEGCGQIEVTWAQHDYGLIQTSVADNWQIRKRVGTDTTYHLVESVNGSYSSIIDKNPNLGQTVSYYVRGENQCGVGSYTNPSTRTLNPRV